MILEDDIRGMTDMVACLASYKLYSQVNIMNQVFVLFSSPITIVAPYHHLEHLLLCVYLCHAICHPHETDVSRFGKPRRSAGTLHELFVNVRSMFALSFEFVALGNAQKVSEY
jgi:hypothetical protein